MKKILFLTLCIFAIILLRWQQTNAKPLHIPDSVKTEACQLITFEGIANNAPIPPIDGVTTPQWLALIDSDAGGTGQFANEPSASTVAYWFDDENSTEREILLEPPVNRLSLYYASFSAITLTAFDSSGNMLDDDSGLPNFNAGPGGDPTGDFDKFDKLNVQASQDNVISKVVVTGTINQTSIDDLEFCTVNEPPTADAGRGYNGVEGVSINLNGGGSSDPDGEIVSYEWDLDDDGQFNDSNGITTTVSFPDEGTYTITLQISDSDGAMMTDSTVVNVANAPPDVDAGGNLPSIFVGDSVNFNQTTFTDFGSLDTHTATIDWGDGTELETVPTQNGQVKATYQYGKSGNFMITVCVTDNDGGKGCDSIFIEVKDIPAMFVIYFPIILTSP